MDKTNRKGLAAGLAAYVMWGILPVYWKTLGAVPPLELLAWRVAGCAVVAWMVILWRRRVVPRSVMTGRSIGFLILAALLIAGNWGLYIWAVSSNRILEASLGYYMNPLVNVILGVVFFSEKLGRRRLIAIVLASGAVVVMILGSGVIPWVSLLLALQFGFYGLAVKSLPKEIDSIETLAWEMVVLGPPAVAYLVYLGAGGSWHIVSEGNLTTGLLLASGVVTLLPQIGRAHV